MKKSKIVILTAILAVVGLITNMSIANISDENISLHSI